MPMRARLRRSFPLDPLRIPQTSSLSLSLSLSLARSFASFTLPSWQSRDFDYLLHALRVGVTTGLAIEVIVLFIGCDNKGIRFCYLVLAVGKCGHASILES